MPHRSALVRLRDGLVDPATRQPAADRCAFGKTEIDARARLGVEWLEKPKTPYRGVGGMPVRTSPCAVRRLTMVVPKSAT